MSNERPYVVDGEFTKWFHQDVAAADAQARARIAELPKCQLCNRPMCLGQPAAHYTCVGVPK
jgi:hypothetical protein